MKPFLTRFLLIALLAIVLPSGAYAQATRTWVSGVGDDANPGSRTAPCKTFAGAIAKTAPGGEIDALDPGGFGALTITKSITLDGGGGQVASVLVAGTNGLVIAAGATDVVTIRNMRLQGLLGNRSSPGNAGLNGIRVLSAAAVTIENCDIDGFNVDGIDVAAGANCKVTIINTRVTNCAGDGIHGNTSSGSLYVSVKNCEITNCGNGVHGDSAGVIEVSHSGITGCTNNGLNAENGVGLHSYDNIVSNNGNAGIRCLLSSVVLGNTKIISNTIGIQYFSGGVYTYGNNVNTGNSSPGAPTTTLTTQ